MEIKLLLPLQMLPSASINVMGNNINSAEQFAAMIATVVNLFQQPPLNTKY